ncbi:MAG: Asp23/Gls24 family envelope stress response protein [Kiritimatiellia bacterium]|nr:Asp23/Gls24 family envelope stress response protein [Kiritimatiellia bacterium]
MKEIQTGARMSNPRTDSVPDGRDDDRQSIRIHNSVIAVIARIAALKVPGVHDLAGSFVDGIVGIVGKQTLEKGVHVTVEENVVTLDVHVIVEYGSFIPKVAWQVQNDVRIAVEKMTGKSVKTVLVIVQGVHVPESSRRSEGTPE